MSTPISRNNKLQGLDLYAPRRARLRTFSSDQTAGAGTPEQSARQWPDSEEPHAERPRAESPHAERPHAEQPHAQRSQTEQQRSDQAGTEQAAVENAEPANDAQEAEVLDWVDQAIRAVIELEHATGGSKLSAARLEDAQSPSVAPAQDDGDEFSPAPSVMPDQGESDESPPPPSPRRQDHDAARAAPRRRSTLDPEIVPEPPPEMKRSGFLSLFVRLSLVIVFAALAAYGLTALASLQPGPLPLKGAIGRVAGIAPQSQPAQLPAPPSRLIVQDQQAFANQPLSLAVNVEDARQNESVLLDGLAQGTTLSAGASASPSSWRLRPDRLRGLYLYAPKDFVGVMNTTVDLLGDNQKLLDSRSMQLKWIATQKKPALPPSFAVASAEPMDGAGGGGAKPAVPAIQPIDPGEAAMLMQRGRDSLSTGDISAARVAFRRLADAGIADAALALARTYDPNYLAAHNVFGVPGDRTTARALYQQAKELGSAEAGRILAQMTVQGTPTPEQEQHGD